MGELETRRLHVSFLSIQFGITSLKKLFSHLFTLQCLWNWSAVMSTDGLPCPANQQDTLSQDASSSLVMVKHSSHRPNSKQQDNWSRPPCNKVWFYDNVDKVWQCRLQFLFALNNALKVPSMCPRLDWPYSPPSWQRDAISVFVWFTVPNN